MCVILDLCIVNMCNINPRYNIDCSIIITWFAQRQPSKAEFNRIVSTQIASVLTILQNIHILLWKWEKIIFKVTCFFIITSLVVKHVVMYPATEAVTQPLFFTRTLYINNSIILYTRCKYADIGLIIPINIFLYKKLSTRLQLSLFDHLAEITNIC